MDNPWEWMWQYANSWRTGPDHSDNWDSTERIIEHNVGLSKYAGNQNVNLHYRDHRLSHAGPTRGWNDLDFLMTGGQVSDMIVSCAPMFSFNVQIGINLSKNIKEKSPAI